PAGDQADERGAPPLRRGAPPADGRAGRPAARRQAGRGPAGRARQPARRTAAPLRPGAVIRALDLSLPGAELRRAARLRGRWTDLMYVPGPGFTSPVESGLYTSSFVIVPVDGRPLRVSSFAVPAFGGELCRLRFEPLVSYRPDNLGSFFEP